MCLQHSVENTLPSHCTLKRFVKGTEPRRLWGGPRELNQHLMEGGVANLRDASVFCQFPFMTSQWALPRNVSCIAELQKKKFLVSRSYLIGWRLSLLSLEKRILHDTAETSKLQLPAVESSCWGEAMALQIWLQAKIKAPALPLQAPKVILIHRLLIRKPWCHQSVLSPEVHQWPASPLPWDAHMCFYSAGNL